MHEVVNCQRDRRQWCQFVKLHMTAVMWGENYNLILYKKRAVDLCRDDWQTRVNRSIKKVTQEQGRLSGSSVSNVSTGASAAGSTTASATSSVLSRDGHGAKGKGLSSLL